jgi:DNA modification methylase
MKRKRYVWKSRAEEFVPTLADGSVNLLCIDPPFFGVVAEEWDNQWSSVREFVEWFVGDILGAFRPKLHPRGSAVFFGGIGSHGKRPFFNVLDAIEATDSPLNLTYRNIITWKKRRAYGKSHDYLFAREEIAWYSASPERTEVTFNIPLLDEKRGYAGFSAKYPAKSEHKRASNVWDDIPELMRPERSCQKPLRLMDRIIQTHSNPGDLVVDCFAGWGSTGISAVQNDRDFMGCEAGSDKEPRIADDANDRVFSAYGNKLAFRKPSDMPKKSSSKKGQRSLW